MLETVVHRIVLALCALMGMVATAVAQAPAANVDLELVLAVDTSGSVNRTRFELQRKGYADAFRDPQVLAAIRSGSTQAISVTMFQWTGPALHVQVVPWTRITDAASANAFADAVENAPRALFGGGTSISGAIDYGVGLLAQDPFKAQRQVIDVSGDGANNAGRPAEAARDEAVAAGIGINGLPISSVEPGLDDFYRDNVIGGPGAFLISVESFEQFGEAVRRKLIIEISGLKPPTRWASGPQPVPTRR